MHDQLTPRSWGGRETFSVTIFGKVGEVDIDQVRKTPDGTLVHIPGALVASLILKYHWSPTAFSNNRRSNLSATGVDLLVYDIDEGDTVEGADKRLSALGCAYIVAPTRNHQGVKLLPGGGSKPACDRFRIILPLCRTVTPEEYPTIWNQMKTSVAPTCDSAARDLSRFYFASTEVAHYCDGDPIDVDAVLASAPPLPKPISLSARRLTRVSEASVHNDGVAGVLKLSARCKKFLREGAKDNWNQELLIAASNMRENGVALSDALELLAEPTRLPEFAEVYGGKLTDDDVRTVEQAYSYPNRDKEEQTSFEIDFASQLLESNYKLHITSDRVMRFYFVKDPTARILEPISATLSKFEQEVATQTLFEGFYQEYGRLPKPEVRSRAFDHWLASTPKLETPPKQFAFDDGKNLDYALVRLPAPTPGPFPAWEEFLSRLSDREAFMGMTWSLYEPKHRGRQYVWMQGRGKDGKSVVLRVLCRSLGRAGAALTKPQTENPRFLYGYLEHARGVFYGDCKNPHFSQSEVLRQITGGDTAVVENKHANAYTAPIYCRLMIASNYDPAMSGDFADMSRLILLHVTPPTKIDPAWEEELQEQLPHFLYACREVYERICPLHDEIAVNEVTKELVSGVIAESEEMFAALFDALFTQNSHCSVSGAEMKAAIQGSRWARSMTPCKQGDFKRWMERERSVVVSRTRDGVKYDGVFLKQQHLLEPKGA